MNTTVTKLWNKNFIMLVIGWEFNLIGSALLQFVLPLYVLLETGDPALMGTVLAISSVPFIILTPIGGVIADRINKRKLLAVMNLATAIAIIIYFGISGIMEIVPATVIMMLVLFAFESMISPSVEASVPVLVPAGELVRANSITFLLTTFSSIGSPIIGGFILERFGVTPILFISIACYLLATIIKFLAKIPYTKQDMSESLSKTIMSDTKDGVSYVTKVKPALGKVILIITLFGVTLGPILSAVSVLVTTHLEMGETMVGLTRGLVVIGGTAGVMLISFLREKANVTIVRTLLLISSIAFIPVGIAIMWSNNYTLTYIILIVSFFIMFASNTIMGIINWSYLGEKSPEHLVGKVLSLASAFMFLGIAVGNYLYGFLLNHFIETPAIALFIIAGASTVVALGARIKE